MRLFDKYGASYLASSLLLATIQKQTNLLQKSPVQLNGKCFTCTETGNVKLPECEWF